ncbi:hypothetical protein NPIL_392331 [Nephila pilipes]|uniref:Uncharacterized protein n=1 Tax=Nephila pilipes TaxID=299642 RepID=A0A8X6TEN7_NEPPI|nr:hypothetical protein NPIL_392331 [Nephila pilipes]
MRSDSDSNKHSEPERHKSIGNPKNSTRVNPSAQRDLEASTHLRDVSILCGDFDAHHFSCDGNYNNPRDISIEKFPDRAEFEACRSHRHALAKIPHPP